MFACRVCGADSRDEVCDDCRAPMDVEVRGMTAMERKSAKPSQYIHLRWKVGADAYGQHELIEIDAPGYWPTIIGRSDVAAHIVKLHNRWLDRRIGCGAGRGGARSDLT